MDSVHYGHAARANQPRASSNSAKAGFRRGTLFASGLIVGESIVGVVLAGVIVASVTNGGSEAPLAIVGKDFADTAEYLGLAVFVLALLVFSKIVLGSKKA